VTPNAGSETRRQALARLVLALGSEPNRQVRRVRSDAGMRAGSARQNLRRLRSSSCSWGLAALASWVSA
jgi:hypothetical protein